MNIRLTDPKDYAVISQWWVGHGWPMVPEQALPKIGCVVLDADLSGIAAAWLYMDNSVGVCWMDWLVTNPKASPLKSVRAISRIVTFLKQVGLDNDYGVMLTACRQDGLVSLYERNGFTKTDEGVTLLNLNLRD